MAETPKLDDKVEESKFAKPDPLKETSKPMADDVKQIKAERDALSRENMALKAELRKVQEAHAQLDTAVKEYASKHGPLPKPREPQEGDSPCGPVAPHAKCPVCGWDADTHIKPGMTGRQPHSV